MTPASPRNIAEIARTISRRENYERVYAWSPLTGIVDQCIDDAAHRIFDLMAALSWDGPFEASYYEFAWALCKSERVIIRKVNLLSKLGIS
jgi:hypothetical protein